MDERQACAACKGGLIADFPHVCDPLLVVMAPMARPIYGATGIISTASHDLIEDPFTGDLWADLKTQP
jgi:hypothetical protein